MDSSEQTTTEKITPAIKLYNTLYNNRSSLLFGLFLCTALGVTAFLTNRSTSGKIQASLGAAQKTELGAFPIVIPTLKYGFALDTFHVFEAEIRAGQFLTDLLQPHHVDYVTIEQLAKNSKDVFDIRRLRAGKPYTILSKDSTQAADYLIYEPDVFQYVVFDLKNSNVRLEKRDVTTEIKAASGVVKSSLWDAMVDNGMSHELTAAMEDALQWSIDFHHVQKEDRFKLIYEEKYVEGKAVGVGKVQAAYYKTGKNEYYALYYDKEGFKGYYDLEGRPMKKGFLKAPVKFSRISSRYNLTRFHPILKRTRPHYGTDYAAPYGTPIYAVGDGVVEQAGHTSGNGNFVKIKHDATYQTQYLHMQKFASGIRTGVHVQQGDVIGYVGSTGLATGPHVCFRFWMNGKQVDHLSIKMPPANPLPESELPTFKALRDEYMKRFETVEFNTAQPIEAQTQEATADASELLTEN